MESYIPALRPYSHSCPYLACPSLLPPALFQFDKGEDALLYWQRGENGNDRTGNRKSPSSPIDKCLFVVDRKDLDRQTREEFNKFQENCVEENTNTETLVRRLLSDDYADKVIVTAAQKLAHGREISGLKAYE